MPTIAYLANQFPATVEPYVSEEIEELRRRGVRVIPGSVRSPHAAPHGLGAVPFQPEILCLQPIRVLTLLRASRLAAGRRKQIAGLLTRIVLRGKESPQRRLKALLHTGLGACYAVQLQDRGVDHIHVHHGYFGSWVAMVAARLLNVSYSLTLHGSDLLVDSVYLDTKLGNCQFCATISGFNRRYLLKHFPSIEPEKIIVSRLGVDVPQRSESTRTFDTARPTFTLLTVGRLHAVKDHALLIRACACLRDRGLNFKCAIAGDGPERQRIESLIRQERLQDHMILLGHVPREKIQSLYERADVVVLTSRSEGIPLTLMEAMAQGRIVLAPKITGIPELVISGKTGFLYQPGGLKDCVEKILFLHELMSSEHRSPVSRLDWIRHAARVQIVHNFNRKKNLGHFAEQFLKRVNARDFTAQNWSPPHEDLVLQQI